MSKKIVAIVTGGYSSEASASVVSSELIYESIDREKYEPYKIFIFKDEWYMLDHNGQKIPVDRSDFSIKISEN